MAAIESPVRVETLSELQIWIKGEFALIAQAQQTSNADIVNVRRTVHDLANQLQLLLALDLPNKLAKLEDADKQHQTSIDKFAIDAVKRGSAVATLKAVYTIFGAVVGVVLTVGFELYKLVEK